MKLSKSFKLVPTFCVAHTAASVPLDMDSTNTTFIYKCGNVYEDDHGMTYATEPEKVFVSKHQETVMAFIDHLQKTFAHASLYVLPILFFSWLVLPTPVGEITLMIAAALFASLIYACPIMKIRTVAKHVNTYISYTTFLALPSLITLALGVIFNV